MRVILATRLSITLFSLTLHHAAIAADKKEVLNDWFALGSGCKAKHDIGGDVQMQRFQVKHGNRSTYGAKFLLQNFELSSEASPNNALSFGKECAVRLNINPPAGKVIKRIYALTELAASKHENSSLLLNSELKIGSVSLGYERVIYKESEILIDKIQHVKIDSSLALIRGFDEMPRLGCGEAKIIAYDFTMITKRKNKTDQVKAGLAGDKSLEIRAELEDCRS